MPPDWKKFEELAAAIQQELAPDAKVTANAMLLGHKSKTQRQIDILIEQKMGQFDLRIAIDCKDSKSPIDVKEVEMVMGLLEDVAVNKGAIVAANGFTAAAKQRAHEAGIDLYNLIDVAKHKWQKYITVPAVARLLRLPHYFEFFLVAKGSPHAAQLAQDLWDKPLLRSNGAVINTIGNIIYDRWDDGSIPKFGGTHAGILLTSEQGFLKFNDSLIEVFITFTAKVDELLFYGQLPLVNFRGLHDEKTGKIMTNGLLQVEWDFEKIEREWQRINSVDELSVTPMLKTTSSSKYPRSAKP